MTKHASRITIQTNQTNYVSLSSRYSRVVHPWDIFPASPSSSSISNKSRIAVFQSRKAKSNQGKLFYYTRTYHSWSRQPSIKMSSEQIVEQQMAVLPPMVADSGSGVEASQPVSIHFISPCSLLGSVLIIKILGCNSTNEHKLRRGQYAGWRRSILWLLWLRLCRKLLLMMLDRCYK